MGKPPLLFSSSAELEKIRDIVFAFARLPFAKSGIPGAVLETVLAEVRKGKIITKRHFVDVVAEGGDIGWQVKSTSGNSPLTWNRARIADQEDLIAESRAGTAGCQALGNAIIAFCNDHAVKSLAEYNLDEIGLARLHVDDNGDALYFERLLCSRRSPAVFNPADFSWKWAEKEPGNKRHSGGFHGFNKSTGSKWFSWFGRGAYQLHFPGEAQWRTETSHGHAIRFRIPGAADRLSVDAFLALMA